jgi:predicted ArsR family transcriptional regulator
LQWLDISHAAIDGEDRPTFNSMAIIGTGFHPNGAAAKVLSRLRHGSMTVEELARALRLTDNAVRNQLRKLQTANFVVLAGKRSGTSKPSTLYAITLEGHIQFSTLYLPVLTQFLAVAEGQCPNTQLHSFMLATGKSLARRYPRPTGGLNRRVHSAAGVLTAFGSVSEVASRDGAVMIRSRTCPLAALTSENAAACNVLQGFLEEHIGARVTVCCDLTDHPQCCFEVRK